MVFAIGENMRLGLYITTSWHYKHRIGCHTSCRRGPKSWIIATALTILVLWAERIDYTREFKSIKNNASLTFASIMCSTKVAMIYTAI